MSVTCLDLVSFADGELEPERAEAFRSHLVTCAACRAGLVEAMQLSARLGALPEGPDSAKPEIAKLVLASPGDLSAVPAPLAPPPRRPRTNLKRGLAPWMGAALAVAAIAMVFLRPRTAPAPEAMNAFAALESRPYNIRLAYANAAHHQPVRGQMRGATSSEQPISYAALDAFQKRGDRYSLAIARMLNGDKLTDVADQLRGLAPAPSIRSDRAAIEVLTTKNDNAESVLTELEALRSSDDDQAARAARWNHAILLATLDLPLSAAQAFRDIADEHEAGWAEEALERAQPLEKRGRDARDSWDRANKAGQALAETGALPPTELVRQFPGVMRAYFYRAVGGAPDRVRVLALAPMAAELDRLGDQPILGDYVQRVAKLDFHRRASLARAYTQLLAHQPLTAAAMTELTNPAASADVVDIVMGAMVELDAVADHLEAFRRMTKQTHDPWFEIKLAEEEARVDVRRGDWLGAEARLRKAEKLCIPAVNYRCLYLARQLGKLYQELHRVPESLAVIREAVDHARSSREWGRSIDLLARLADVERFNSSTATARAYANEVLLMDPDTCSSKNLAYRALAGAAILDVDGRTARRALEAGLRCAQPDLNMANYLADIGRLDPQPGDLAQLRSWLSKLRAGGTLTAAEQVFADEIEGRLLVERDRAEGMVLLERAIAAAEALRHDVLAEKVRAGAYSVLVFDAARNGDYGRVVALIAQEIGVPRPDTCAVGMVAEDERAIVVVRGSDGHDRATYDAARGPRAGAPAASADLARGLAGCAHVVVLAHAALQGQPRVLPVEIPWSYATGARGYTSPQSKAPIATRVLVVTDVKPPAYLQLPPLSPPAPDLTPSTTTLSGPAATPAQVLAAMADASEIQFHTHALVNMGISDASHLVLSPELDGRYALTTEAIRGTALRGRPIVVLAACHSAQGARYQHAAWSLPHAFLAAGASAVFAVASAVQDTNAGPFFTRVLERIHAGVDPATALRDERRATLASDPSSWAADVILFE